MNRESITPLSFIVELLNPPMKHSVPATHKVFDELKDIYANYNRPADNLTEFSAVDKNSQEVKKLIIQNDKIVIINDFTTSTIDGFWKVASHVIKQVVLNLNLPLFFFRQYTVRITASPLKEKDSRLFLGVKLCGLDDNRLRPFGRPIHGFGMRFVVPPTPEHQNEYNIRVESLLQDTNKIFIENQARFLVPLQLSGTYLDKIKSELDATDTFLKSNMSEFLEQYNT